MQTIIQAISRYSWRERLFGNSRLPFIRVGKLDSQDPPYTRATLSDAFAKPDPYLLHLYATLEQEIQRRSDCLTSHGGGLLTSYVIGVTSTFPGEGKSTISYHLARTAAWDSLNRVCLLDLSLQDDQCRNLQLEHPGYGTTDVLTNQSREPSAKIPIGGLDNLTLLPGGEAPLQTGRVVRAPRVAELIREARGECELVIVDLPAVATGYAVPLARHVDGVVLVICAGVTPRQRVQEAIDRIGRDRLLGVVLNRMGPTRF